ncbi:MAG: tetratricopeptide repeat protein [Desulfobacterales bacterium]|nr:tetratricopeptide repeat protein [Desulfobacterales bacterium]
MPKNIYLRTCILSYLFLIIATLAVYWQVNDYQFIGYDDEIYVSGNSHVQDGLTSDSIIWSFTATYAANWHPLTWLSHMLDVHLFGMNSGMHHLTNVFFHIANTLLLFFVLKQMTGDIWQSFFVAALFALHPLHVESVAQIAERKDVLSTFFWLLTIRSYVWYTDSQVWYRYVITIFLFILGLMSKPMLVTLPFVLLLIDYWPLNRLSIVDCRLSIDKIINRQSSIINRQSSIVSHQSSIVSHQSSVINHQSSIVNRQLSIFLEKIPFFILVAALCVVTFFVQQGGGALRTLDLIPLDVRIANALVSYAGYLGKMILPHNLAFLYPHRGMPPAWQTILACVLLISVSIGAVKTVKKHPWFAVGWMWYIGTLVPVIGLVQVGSHSMADRYTYVPLTGIFIIIAWGVPELLDKLHIRNNNKYPVFGKPLLSLAAAAILSVLMACTWIQIRYWSDSITLFEHAIDVTADNAVAHTNLGVTLQEQGRIEEAVYHLSEVLRINPRYAKGHNNLGTALEGMGKTAEAARHYSKALESDPNLVKAHNNMGSLLEKQGSISEAIKHYYEAKRLNPDFVEVRNNLAVALFRSGSAGEAVVHFKEALKIKPDAELHNNFGVALYSMGKLDEAIFHFRKALKIKPDYADSQKNIEKVLAKQKELLNDVAAEIRKDIELDPTNPVLHYRLGNVYRRMKESDKAEEQYQKALSIQPEFPDALNNLGIMLAAKGKYNKAVSLLKKVVEIQPDNARVFYHIACIYARQNKKAESVDWLEKAVKKGYNNQVLLKNDKNLENIRNTSYYKKLMKKVRSEK